MGYGGIVLQNNGTIPCRVCWLHFSDWFWHTGVLKCKNDYIFAEKPDFKLCSFPIFLTFDNFYYYFINKFFFFAYLIPVKFKALT